MKKYLFIQSVLVCFFQGVQSQTTQVYCVHHLLVRSLFSRCFAPSSIEAIKLFKSTLSPNTEPENVGEILLVQARRKVRPTGSFRRLSNIPECVPKVLLKKAFNLVHRVCPSWRGDPDRSWSHDLLKSSRFVVNTC